MQWPVEAAVFTDVIFIREFPPIERSFGAQINVVTAGLRYVEHA